MVSRRTFLKMATLSTAGTILTGVSGIGYMTMIEPNWVAVEHVLLQLNRLDPEFDGFRVVQISDIHLDTSFNQDHLRYIGDLIKQEQPDVMVITGDFISHTIVPYDVMLVEELRRLTDEIPVLAVLGNHDHWTSAGAVREILTASAVNELKNDVWTVERAGKQLHIGGVDDIWEMRHDLARVLRNMPDEGAAILLAHEPDYADISARSGRFDLQLSGHTHGGQVNLPILGRPKLPYLGIKYQAGLYQLPNGMYQYTNRGLGTVLPAVRFNCRPEITVFTLRAVM